MAGVEVVSGDYGLTGARTNVGGQRIFDNRDCDLQIRCSG